MRWQTMFINCSHRQNSWTRMHSCICDMCREQCMYTLYLICTTIICRIRFVALPCVILYYAPLFGKESEREHYSKEEGKKEKPKWSYRTQFKCNCNSSICFAWLCSQFISLCLSIFTSFSSLGWCALHALIARCLEILRNHTQTYPNI